MLARKLRGMELRLELVVCGGVSRGKTKVTSTTKYTQIGHTRTLGILDAGDDGEVGIIRELSSSLGEREEAEEVKRML